MAFPFLVPLIAAGASVIQSGINAWQSRRNTDRTISANRHMAEYAYSRDVEMMNKQNEYNRQMWQMSNEYNAPAAQMARLKQAGLSPNLVYGGGGAPGNTQGPPPRSEMARYAAPSAQYNYAPVVDLPSMLSLYQDFSVKQAQVDNLKAQTENTRSRTINESIQSGLLRMKGESGRFSFEQMKKLAPYAADIAAAQAHGVPIKNALMFEQMESTKVEKELKRKQLSNMDKLREKLDADVLFAQYRNQWMKMGITSSDNIFLRMITRMLGESGINPAELLSK